MLCWSHSLARASTSRCFPAGGVAEKQDQVNLVVGDARADLLAAALGAGQVQRDGQARGFAHQLAGGVGGADVVTGQDAAVGNAKLHHQFFLSVVGQKRDIQRKSPLLRASPAGACPSPVDTTRYFIIIYCTYFICNRNYFNRL